MTDQDLERQRLAFIGKRDGFFSMMEFARRTKGQYLAAIRKARRAGPGEPRYGLAYRKQLLRSCLVFRGVLCHD